MKRLFFAFVIGGAFSVVGQIFIWGWSAVLGSGHDLVNPLTMVTMGALGFVLFVSGVAPKLESLTTMGVTIPISGMVIAIGGVTAGAKAKTGSTESAIKAGAGLPLRVLGLGASISVALCCLLWFTTHGALELPIEPDEFGFVIDFVLAFLVGGLIALIAEAILIVTKAPIPVLLIIFIVAGALLAAFNLDSAAAMGNGGFTVSLLAAGEAAYKTFELLLMGITPIPFITVLCVYIAVTILGILAGLVKR